MADAVPACIDRGERWKLLGFVDDDPGRTDTTIDGLPVLGPIDTVRARTDTRLVVGTGSTGQLHQQAPHRQAPRPANGPVCVNRAPGCVDLLFHDDRRRHVVLAGTVATTSVRIGNHVAIMPGVVLTHDDLIEDYATLTSGVRLGGTVHIGTGAYIGAGALCARAYRSACGR